jgi:metal-sulfur cluster biosynthetic enzyme
MPTEAEIRAALNEVIHPSFGMSLIVLDMVRAVHIAQSAVTIDLVMNCPGCPAGEIALALACHRIEALQVGAVRLNLLLDVWTPPWEKSS